MLTPDDELRHEPTDAPNWRESVYFAFADPNHEIGAWIYLWILPNLNKSGVVMSFYHGVTRVEDTMKVAMAAPGHLHSGADGEWAYAYHTSVPGVPESDFDNVVLSGLHLRRIGPNEGYEIEFSDGDSTSASFRYLFTTAPYDYSQGACACPPWLAENRYHRSGRVEGELRIASERYAIDASGDADHSWGPRDVDRIGKGDFTLWAFRHPDDAINCSAISMSEPGDSRHLGFLQVDGSMASIQSITDSVTFDDDALQTNMRLEITDVAGRTMRATMPRPFAAIRLGNHKPGWSWGYEAMGSYDVEGYGPCAGTVAYYWPGHVSALDLVRQGRLTR